MTDEEPAMPPGADSAPSPERLDTFDAALDRLTTIQRTALTSHSANHRTSEESMEPDERTTHQESHWRWPQEPHPANGPEGTETIEMLHRRLGLPDGVTDHEQLCRAVVEAPDDDAPRQAYAAWMSGQSHDFARLVGGFIEAQLRVAQAFRHGRSAEVAALRRWTGTPAYVSMTDFRAGDTLRPWFLDRLAPLIARGLIGWPQIYRGFVERVGVRAHRFLQIADELFRLAPIRYLVLIGVPDVVEELAASPHLARIRSLSLPRYASEDELTDDVLNRLLSSPHLGRLAHLRLVHQRRLTPRAYGHAVASPTLPHLSSFEVVAPAYRWNVLQPSAFDPPYRSQRMIGYDTAIRSRFSTDWIPTLERVLGYLPCLHREEHYGREGIDIESIVERPIALDAAIMARRGRRVA